MTSVDLHQTGSPGNQDDENHLSEHETVWRLLSHDAFAPAEAVAFPEREPPPHIAAYKISTALRLAQVAFSLFSCCLASGIVWGFAALKPVLVAEGVYRELCNTDDESYSEFNTFRTGKGDLQIPCPKQDMRLNFFFVAASNTANVSTLLAGAALDRFGRRICYMISSGFLAVGCILMGSAFTVPKFDGYLSANLFFAFGGTFLFVPSFQLANAFPKHSGIVVALVTGAFDSSAAVFLFYRMAYRAFNGHFSPSRFFFGYLLVPLLIFLAELTFMPSKAYHSTLELEQKIRKAQDATRDIHESDDEITSDSVLRRVRHIRAEHRHAKLDQIEDLLGDVDELQQRVKLVEESQAHFGAWQALHDAPTYKQMLTPWFILLLLLTILQMLRMNYFIATIRAQYRYMLHSDEAAMDINHFFDAALPIAGVVSTPFIGLLLNKLSITATLATLTVFVALLGILNCLPFLWAGYATVVAFVIFRPLYYSVMSDYAIKVFGFATFGRIYGATVGLSGLVNFAQPSLDALTHGPLRNNPTAVNIFMTVAGTMAAASLTLFVGTTGRGFKEVEPDEVDERTSLVRQEDEGYETMVNK